MRKLDRVVHFDDRSRNFPIRSAVGERKPRSYTWRCNPYLDQGYEGACVGFAWAHELAARPFMVPDVTEGTARHIYRSAKLVDEWPGEDYEGTSVLAGAKAVADSGFMPEYRWAFGLNDLTLAVGYKGPAVLGLNWYEGMADTDKEGYIRPTGSVVGGHAIVCVGVSIKNRRFLLHNSWGSGWGLGGNCLVDFADMERLLHEQGEACIPVQRRYSTKKEG